MSLHPAVSNGSYDVAEVRADFPALALEVYGKRLVYLDNAASAQKPRQVLTRMTQAYESEYANVHRGLHYLANAATEAFEGGPIAALRDADEVTIDVDGCRLDVALSDEEIAPRLAERPAPRPAYMRGVLAKYARLVADASRGAVTDWAGREES